MSIQEASKGGEFNYYWKTGDTTNVKKINVSDFNCTIEFSRCTDEKHNKISIFNGNTEYKLAKYPDGVVAAPLLSDYEPFALGNIFSLDGNKKDFSNEDFKIMLSKRNKVVKLNNKYAYKVVATDEDIKAGKVTVELRDILADGSTGRSGRTITIDIETPKEKEQKEEERLDRAYADKHYIRAFFGITREEFEKHNSRDY